MDSVDSVDRAAFTVPMDLDFAKEINKTLCLCYFAMTGNEHMLNGQPAPIENARAVSLSQMVMATKMVSGLKEKGKINLTLDDRAIAALYVFLNYKTESDDEIEPILQFDGAALVKITCAEN